MTATSHTCVACGRPLASGEMQSYDRRGLVCDECQLIAEFHDLPAGLATAMLMFGFVQERLENLSQNRPVTL